MRLRTLSAAGAGLIASLLPAAAFAHAFGQAYVLPLPISLYIAGAGAAVFASFVILSFFSAPSHGGVSHTRSYTLPAWLTGKASVSLGKAVGLGVLALALAAGFMGSSDVTKNPELFLFWIGLLLVVTYVSALIANVWERFDPFRTLAMLFFGNDYRPFFAYPAWLRYVPALVFFYFLLWFELLSYGAGASPLNVAFVLLEYIIVTLFGVGLFGAEAWFKWGDFFSVYFGVVGRFAPLQLSEKDVALMRPGERLVNETPDGRWFLVFTLLMLSSTSFDGLRETLPWVHFFGKHPLLLDAYALVVPVILVLSPLFFLSLLALAVYAMKLITRYPSFTELMNRFTFSLVPIAIAYNVAHYFSLIVSEGQNFFVQLSDPLGKGWDLFGTAAYTYNPALLSAKTIWYVEVAAIVIGHIVATYIAHRVALREFKSRTHVIVGQLPVLALMIFFTGLGLWILSLPFAT